SLPLSIFSSPALLDQVPHFPESDQEVPIMPSLKQHPYFKNFSIERLEAYSDDMSPKNVVRVKAKLVRKIGIQSKTDEAFVNIQSMMSEVSDRCLQIATASEEQTSVVDEIQKNIISIRDLAGENRHASRQTSDASKELHVLVGSLESMGKAFEK
ncbi:MAG: hypothetical protein ACPGF7_15020, partial [Pontibacterium sp.]